MRAREREQSARLTYFKVCYLSDGYLIVEVLDYSVLPCFLIEPPYDFTLLNTKSGKTAISLANTHNKIFWNDRENSFPQTRKYLRTITSGKQIISKGVEKKRFLQKFFGSRQLINIEEMGCPSLNRIKGNRFPYCETHLYGGVCTLNNVYIILTFFKSSSKILKKIVYIILKLRLAV